MNPITRGARFPIAALLILTLATGCAFVGGVGERPGERGSRARAISAAADTLLLPLARDGATVAAVVGRPDGAILYAHEPDRLVMPASVQKLFVAADVIAKLPADYRFTTTVFSTGPLDTAGVLHGDLVLSGGWDPSLSGPRPYSHWPWAAFDSLAARVAVRGVKQIEGALVVEAAAFIPASWEVGDFRYRFAPPIAQLMFNDGLVSRARQTGGFDTSDPLAATWPDPVFWRHAHDRLRGERAPAVLAPARPVPPLAAELEREETEEPLFSGELWSIDWSPSPRPRLLAADAFRQSLRRAGVEGADSSVAIEKLPGSLDAPAAGGIRIVHESAPLDSLLAPMLHVSSNAWAEQIAAAAGSLDRGEYRPTWPDVLDTLAIARRPGLRAADACGMSRHNTLRARTVFELLVAANDRWGERWTALLPHADERGTSLAGRLSGLEDVVLAKTGALSRCASLAGYLVEQGRPVLAFAVIVNHDGRTPEGEIDAFVRALVSFVFRDSSFEM